MPWSSSRKRLLLLTVILLLSFFSQRFQAQAAEQLIFSIPSSGGGVYAAIEYIYPNTAATGSGAAGQNFPMSGEYRLTTCTFLLRKSGNPQGHVAAYLFRQNGTYNINARPLGYEPLAESNLVDMNEIGGEPTFINFTFATQPLLNEPYYWLVMVPHDNSTFYGEGQAINVCETLPETMIGDICYHRKIWLVYDSNWTLYVYGENISSAQEMISENLGLAAALLITCFILVFIINLVYVLSSGKTENLVPVLTAYVIAAIMLAGLSLIMLTI